jgi:glycosidase
MVPTDFWEQARKELSQIKPDIIMLAEASKPELLTNAFDLDYSWPLLATMNDVIEHDAPAANIRKTWEQTRREFPRDALHLRISDDHDEARAVARYGIDGALAASALMFTLDGVPLLYNGMEVGDATESGDPALFDKLTIFWQPKGRPELRKIYHDLIQFREQNPALCGNHLEWIHNSDEKNLVTFLRADDKDQFLVAINFSNRPTDSRVDVKDVAGFNAVNISGADPANGALLPALHLNGFGWRIYHRATPIMAAK